MIAILLGAVIVWMLLVALFALTGNAVMACEWFTNYELARSPEIGERSHYRDTTYLPSSVRDRITARGAR